MTMFFFKMLSQVMSRGALKLLNEDLTMAKDDSDDSEFEPL